MSKMTCAGRVTNGVIYSVLEPHVVSPLFLIQAGEASHPYASQVGGENIGYMPTSKLIVNWTS